MGTKSFSVKKIRLSQTSRICNIFNKYFVNVAKDIGKKADQYRDDFSDHPCIEIFLENTQQSNSEETFSFNPVEEKYVHKIISNLKAKKATGADNISAKLLKTCAASISRPISNLKKKKKNGMT